MNSDDICTWGKYPCIKDGPGIEPGDIDLFLISTGWWIDIYGMFSVDY